MKKQGFVNLRKNGYRNDIHYSTKKGVKSGGRIDLSVGRFFWSNRVRCRDSTKNVAILQILDLSEPYIFTMVGTKKWLGVYM